MARRIAVEPAPVAQLEKSDNIFQSPMWAELKASFGWSPRVFRLHWRSQETTLLTLYRTVADGQSALYVPAGPDLHVDAEEHGRFLESLSEAMAPHLPSDMVYVRYDLPWSTPYFADSSPQQTRGGWGGQPEHRIREMRMNFGTRTHSLRKATTDIQPPDTLVVDLHTTSNALLASMRPKTRYNIRLAQKRGVHVRQGETSDLPLFYQAYEETTRRNRIRLHDYRYFERILQVAVDSGEETDAVLLLAETDGNVLAGMILGFAGSRATYLYGASSNVGRRLMPTYALQWRAMDIAQTRGCETYDLFGIPPNSDAAHPMHGLYRFKTGFGGRFVHRRGCWDFPYREEEYERICEHELTVSGYHL